jgi:hypothetical protein
MKLKSELIFINFSISLMSLPTPSQSVSHKRFHQCLNHKKKLNLRHPLPTFGSFSFFQASILLGVDKVLQKLTKSYKSELRHLFQCRILISMKCPRKTPFQHTVPLPPWFRRLGSFFVKQTGHCTLRSGEWIISQKFRVRTRFKVVPLN